MYKPLFLSFLILLALLTPLRAQMRLAGTVTRELDSRPLAYAQVRVVKGQVGTMTNAEGEFSLFIHKLIPGDSLQISYIGYESIRFPIAMIPEGMELDIRLKEVAYVLDPVLISAIEPVDIVRRAIAAIPDNYQSEPAQMKAFFRELLREDDVYIGLWEAVLDIYKEPIKQGDEGMELGGGRVKLLHSRLKQAKSQLADEAEEGFDYLSDGPQDVLSKVIIGDLIALHFLDEDNFKRYDYSIEGLINAQGRELYKIGFRQRKKEKKRLYVGELFIDSKSFAIASLSYELNKEIERYDIDQYLDLKERMAMGMVRRFGIDLMLLKESGRIDYQRIGDKWYLSFYQHRGAIHLLTPGKIGASFLGIGLGKSMTLPENLRYYFAREMAVTELDTANLNRFNDDELLDPAKPLGEQLGNFDDDFWEQYNYLKPTHSLRNIARDMSEGD